MAMKRKYGSLTNNQQFINIRCSVEEKKKIQELAAKAKISMSQYIILKCLSIGFFTKLFRKKSVALRMIL